VGWNLAKPQTGAHLRQRKKETKEQKKNAGPGNSTAARGGVSKTHDGEKEGAANPWEEKTREKERPRSKNLGRAVVPYQSGGEKLCLKTKGCQKKGVGRSLEMQEVEPLTFQSTKKRRRGKKERKSARVSPGGVDIVPGQKIEKGKQGKSSAQQFHPRRKRQGPLPG